MSFALDEIIIYIYNNLYIITQKYGNPTFYEILEKDSSAFNKFLLPSLPLLPLLNIGNETMSSR